MEAVSMPTQLMTHYELAAAWGVSREAARKRSRVRACRGRPATIARLDGSPAHGGDAHSGDTHRASGSHITPDGQSRPSERDAARASGDHVIRDRGAAGSVKTGECQRAERRSRTGWIAWGAVNLICAGRSQAFTTGCGPSPKSHSTFASGAEDVPTRNGQGAREACA
jgi:hypothetical protein